MLLKPLKPIPEKASAYPRIKETPYFISLVEKPYEFFDVDKMLECELITELFLNLFG